MVSPSARTVPLEIVDQVGIPGSWSLSKRCELSGEGRYTKLELKESSDMKGSSVTVAAEIEFLVFTRWGRTLGFLPGRAALG